MLDASSLLRFLLGEAGGETVEVALSAAQRGVARAVISTVNWGEVVGKIYKSQGRSAADALTATFRFYGLEMVPATTERAANAALLKVDWKLGYADAFCLELAISIPGSILVTADHDFQLVVSVVTVDFLPTKPKP